MSSHVITSFCMIWFHYVAFNLAKSGTKAWGSHRRPETQGISRNLVEVRWWQMHLLQNMFWHVLTFFCTIDDKKTLLNYVGRCWEIVAQWILWWSVFLSWGLACNILNYSAQHCTTMYDNVRPLYACSVFHHFLSIWGMSLCPAYILLGDT